MNLQDLKPCPFCGEKAVLETFTTAMEKVPRYRVRCSNCFCETNWDFFSKEDVIKAWNRRHETVEEKNNHEEF